jgi:UDP-N-acetyl-D-glucosamine dehydrogenase
MTTTHADKLLEKIENKTALVGIIGLGYVGLPLALAFTEKGFNVLGLDVDPVKIDQLTAGECYIKHLDCERVERAVAASLFEATTDFARLAEPDAILICVPTPLGPHREPDMRYVEKSTMAIQDTLRPGQLVILESTTYPGTTDELLKPILENACHPERSSEASESKDLGGGEDIEPLKCGSDFFLAFSPEREDPGNPSFGTTNTPKVVGGVDETSGDLAQALYDQIVDSTVRVASARIAEAAKLTENIFRSVNIALVNELKIIYDRLGIDIWDVLDAAETKPFGFMRFNPGPGLGGHCIPLDPFYLAWRAREAGVPTRFIELAGEINTSMPGYVIEKLQAALNERGKTVKGARILILGLAYKPDIDDPRESPAFEIIDRLVELGAEVSYNDPHIPVAPSMRSWPDLPPMESVELDPETLNATDAAVLVTDHSKIDYDLVLEHAALVIDTRGVFRDTDNKVRPA